MASTLELSTFIGNNAQTTEKRYCRKSNNQFVCLPGTFWSWRLPSRWRLLAWGKTSLLHPVHPPTALPQVFRFRRINSLILLLPFHRAILLTQSFQAGRANRLTLARHRFLIMVRGHRPPLRSCPSSLRLRLDQAPIPLKKTVTVSSLTT